MQQKYYCGVVGNPIKHSMSPKLHLNFAKQYNIALEYKKILATTSNFDGLVRNFFANGGTGLNITAPFKKNAFLIADITTKRAMNAESANTLWLQDGLIMADSTDGAGFVKHLKELNCNIKNILFLGAGGAVRSICYELLPYKFNLFIKNRTLINTQLILDQFPEIKIFDKNQKYDLIVQATSSRYYSVDWENLLENSDQNTIMYDLNYYNEQASPWLLWSKKHQMIAFDGYQMLYNQAEIAFLIWFSKFICQN
jgi:shikimate dehydrogenase